MTKQEIINAINATIVANGQKGITAESLKNILNEMVNATPEGGSGGGDGLLKVYLPDPILGDGFAQYGGFNLEIYNQLRTDLEGMGIPSTMLDAYGEVVSEYLEANATAYQTLIQKAQNKEGAVVLIDTSKAYSISGLLMYDPTGEHGIEIKGSIGFIGNAMVDSILAGDENIITISISLANEEIRNIYGDITLESDGSLTFSPSLTTEYTLIIPNNGESLDVEQIAANADFAHAINNSPGATLGAANIVVRFSKSGSLDFMTAATLLTSEIDGFGFKGTYLDGITVKQVEVSEDGTTTVTTIGTLTA